MVGFTRRLLANHQTFSHTSKTITGKISSWKVTKNVWTGYPKSQHFLCVLLLLLLIYFLISKDTSLSLRFLVDLTTCSKGLAATIRILVENLTTDVDMVSQKIVPAYSRKPCWIHGLSSVQKCHALPEWWSESSSMNKEFIVSCGEESKKQNISRPSLSLNFFPQHLFPP